MSAGAARIAVVGSINVDIVVRSQRLPGPGETLHGDSFAITLGGKGANQACAAARLGAGTLFLGAVGKDSFGDVALKELAGFGLDLTHTKRTAEAGTGIATIQIDAAGQNAITVVAGANALVSVADVEAIRGKLSASAVLLLQCETPFDASIAAARIVKAAGGHVILDPAPAPPGGLPAELLELADFITPNESEAAALAGIAVTDRDSAAAAAARLLAMGARGCVLKLGAAGLVYALPGGEGGFAPAFAVKTLDTVAAGDCFNAGLAVALAERLTLQQALRLAAACGALAVTRSGAAAAAPTRGEVETLLAAASRSA